MPDLMVKDIPEEELHAIATRAARHGRSSEDEVRHLVHEAASEERLVIELERARQAVEATRALNRTDSVSAAPAAPPRRRYRSVEPTPRRRGPAA